ncbi:class I SAM-dependent methyltransferase (plasmid) [Peteryoungia desertarenae]|uniref:Class I SAM-dependent methyltransferase n=1 Tax=Peteryoungia desertarenae TaxID=1813451 RepID=A0ABX6QU02_9HYPH|nr:class I SAM-dependent methyltransferase [Peteryoungia desertarenae]QLF71687.1 class I SAM-dependent methyltransferase [Peteryoungia desertarenae]
MAQSTSGFHAILSNPRMYSLFQNLMGARQGWRNYVADHLKPWAGMRILDIGSGPCDILEFLPPVEYYGYDISSSYIERARARFGDRGRFAARLLTIEEIAALPKMDVVLGSGLLHHLDDEVAVDLMRLAFEALKPGGRLLTIDPVLEKGQNPVARLLISLDRGQNVRTRVEYEALARSVFHEPVTSVKHKVWIPYTHCMMCCTRN